MADDKVEKAVESKLREKRAQAVLRDVKKLSSETLEDIVIGGEQELSTRESAEEGGIVHISDIADEIEEAAKTWGKVSGLTTGLPSLDERIGGLKPGELTLIGGETNNGKSALAQNIAVNVAKNHGVLFITLEMRKGEAGSRFRHMNGGTIEGLDIYFQTEYQIDYRHLEKIFESGIEEGVELVVLDYLQYLGRGMTHEEVAKMSKLMKQLALKYEVPFIVIVSLRKAENGKFKRKWFEIETEDLMGTAAIGYDADVILVASRKNLDNEFETDKFFCKVVKARNMAIDYEKRIAGFDWDKTRITEPKDGWIPTSARDVTEEEFNTKFGFGKTYRE